MDVFSQAFPSSSGGGPIATFSISVTDNKDGTVDVTSDAVADIQFFASTFAGKYPNTAWTAYGIVPAGGTLTATLPAGPYFGLGRYSDQTSEVVGFRCSNNALGIHDRCVDGIRSYIMSLSLPGIPSDPTKHVIVKKPIRATKELGRNPQGIYYWKNPEQQRSTYNTISDFTFPVQVLVVAGNGGDNSLDTDWSLAREIASRSLQGCPLAGDVDEIHSVDVRHMVIYAESEVSSLDVGSIVFDCKSQLRNLIV